MVKRHIAIYTCHKSSNFASGYTDFDWQLTTNFFGTLTDALNWFDNSQEYNNLTEKILYIKRCKSGQLAYTQTGYYQIMAIFK